ncbi:MAG: tyrosine--tRNA ligase [Gemmataceae bacterium]
MEVLAELESRGLVYQATDLDGLREHLREPRRVYCGFDPTAPSLTLGNLAPLLILAHFQRRGHTPVVVLGGATGLIGDPSGKSAERQLLDSGTVAANLAGQRRVFEAVLDCRPESPNAVVFLDNSEWLSSLSFLGALRDIEKHFSVNEMIRRDSVRDRLTREQGISYTEFSYALLQAWDFHHLAEARGVTVQVGGSDQWGNIVSGVDLARRLQSRSVYGLTCPLVTKADGGKFGKSEAGAVWLTADRTSPFALYQFFVNTTDAEAGRYLRLFTFLPLEDASQLEREHQADPGRRGAQRALAREVTALVHGPAAAREAEEAADRLFAGDIAVLPVSVLLEALRGVPTTTHSLTELRDGPRPLADVLVTTGVCTSKREARELLAAGAVSLNGVALRTEDTFTAASLLEGRLAAFRRGKKNWYLGIWE